MAKSKSNKSEIISITYKSNGKIFTAKPVVKKASTTRVILTPHADAICTPGETKCENGVEWKCLLLEQVPTWFESNKPCP